MSAATARDAAEGSLRLSGDSHPEAMDAEIEAWVRPRDIHVVAATVGEDEHSVGMREIIDIKHGGLEKYAFH